jgi:hypothetical protein
MTIEQLGAILAPFVAVLGASAWQSAQPFWKDSGTWN